MKQINTPDALGLPDVSLGKTGLRQTQLATEANIDYMLSDMGFSMRFNSQSYTPEMYDAAGSITREPAHQREAFSFFEDMCLRLRINNLDRVRHLLVVIAMRSSYHPMQEWIDSHKWDGKDRIGDLVATVPVEDANQWGVYLRKWMFQVCEAVYGEDGNCYSLPHVLVFTGAQGLGKTSWLKTLAPKDFVCTEAELALNTANAKDSLIHVLGYPIVELGEIDSSFKKSDVSALKVMLSRPVDEIRRPYARAPEKNKRRTVFFGTVNHEEFLVDQSGSRRFWPVNVTGLINIKHGIDVGQLWAQVAEEFWAMVGSGIDEPWLLSKAENAQRELQSRSHMFESAAVQAVRNSFEISGVLNDKGEDVTTYCLANATEIMQMAGLGVDNSFTIAEVKTWLAKTLGKHRKLLGKQRCWCVPKLLPSRGNVRVTPEGVISVKREDALHYLSEMRQDGFNYNFGSRGVPVNTKNNVTDFPKK